MTSQQSQVNKYIIALLYRGWDVWMASLTQWTWAWVDSGSWWWTGRPGVLQSMGSQRVRHEWVTEVNWCMGKCNGLPESIPLISILTIQGQHPVLPILNPLRLHSQNDWLQGLLAWWPKHLFFTNRGGDVLYPYFQSPSSFKNWLLAFHYIPNLVDQFTFWFYI